MVEIEIRQEEREAEIELAGHIAGGGPDGNLGCAALSMLIQSVGAWAVRQPQLRTVYRQEESGGAHLYMLDKAGDGAEIRTALGILRAGVRLLAEAFPGEVRER